MAALDDFSVRLVVSTALSQFEFRFDSQLAFDRLDFHEKNSKPAQFQGCLFERNRDET